jgi:hypothetical protein
VTVSSDAELLSALTTFEAFVQKTSYDSCVRTIVFDGAKTAYLLNRTITLTGSEGFVGLVLDATGHSDMVTITATGGRHFHLSGVNFTAENVRFSGGVMAESGGGSIYAAVGSNLTFRHVAFTENAVSGYAGKGLSDTASEYLASKSQDTFTGRMRVR